MVITQTAGARRTTTDRLERLVSRDTTSGELHLPLIGSVRDLAACGRRIRRLADQLLT